MTLVDQLIGQAEAELGKPYAYGDEGPNKFDCSGLMQFVFGKIGIKLPRTADQQYRFAKPITAPSPGDLVFFVDGQGTAQHVALYIGNGKMLSAPHAGAVVHISNVSNESGRVIHYGRVAGLGAGTAPIIGTVVDVTGTAASTVAGWLGGAQEIVIQGVFGILGLGLLGYGVYRLTTSGKG